MKREFLRDLGLSDEVIDKIIKQYGSDIEKYKANISEQQGKIEYLEQVIKERDQQLEKLQSSDDDMQALKKEIETLRAENKSNDENYQKQIRQLKIKSNVEKALTKAGAKNQELVMLLLKDVLETGELDENGEVKGLEKHIKSLQEDKKTEFLFERQEPQVQGKVPGESTVDTQPTQPNYKNMTYEQICEAMKNTTKTL